MHIEWKTGRLFIILLRYAADMDKMNLLLASYECENVVPAKIQNLRLLCISAFLVSNFWFEKRQKRRFCNKTVQKIFAWLLGSYEC